MSNKITPKTMYKCLICKEVFDPRDRDTPTFKDARECPECHTSWKNLEAIDDDDE